MAYLGLETIRRGNTSACVQDIFTLHFPDAKSALDCTYGAGRFWNWPHSLKITGVDIDPPVAPPDGVELVVSDYRQLDNIFEPGQFDVMCFDPVFIFSKGIRRVIGTKRFFRGAEEVEPALRTYSTIALQKPKNPRDLLEHYRRIFEQRNLASKGMILKGQDLVVGKDRDYWSFNVMNLALKMGMGMPSDLLIQHSPYHRMIDPRWQQQFKFRTVHCSWLIYHFN